MKNKAIKDMIQGSSRQHLVLSAAGDLFFDRRMNGIYIFLITINF